MSLKEDWKQTYGDTYENKETGETITIEEDDLTQTWFARYEGPDGREKIIFSGRDSESDAKMDAEYWINNKWQNIDRSSLDEVLGF